MTHASKKYKTVAGYLRSAGRRFFAQEFPDDHEQMMAAVSAGQRDILNGLLPQLGINGRIQDDESPHAIIASLLDLAPRMGANEQQIAALKECRNWLGQLIISFPPAVAAVRGRAGDDPEGQTS